MLLDRLSQPELQTLEMQAQLQLVCMTLPGPDHDFSALHEQHSETAMTTIYTLREVCSTNLESRIPADTASVSCCRTQSFSRQRSPAAAAAAAAATAARALATMAPPMAGGRSSRSGSRSARWMLPMPRPSQTLTLRPWAVSMLRGCNTFLECDAMHAVRLNLRVALLRPFFTEKPMESPHIPAIDSILITYVCATVGPATDLQMLAALEGLPSEPELEGPTMMGRLARELMLSGQGAAGLQQFKVSRCGILATAVGLAFGSAFHILRKGARLWGIDLLGDKRAIACRFRVRPQRPEVLRRVSRCIAAH